MKYEAGLVLEGGGMRASYTQGVLDFFMENDIDFTYIVGVSAGVGCGMNFISKQIGRACTLSVEYGDDKRVVGIGNLIKHGQYFNLDTIYNKLDKEVFFDYDAFNKSDTTFYAGCFNILSGEVEYFSKKSMENSTKPIIATSSLPLLSKIVEINGKKYLDGGIKDSIPLNKSLQDGNKKNVVILTNPIEYRRPKESSLPLVKVLYFRYPKLIEALKQRDTVYNNMLDKINEMEKNNEVFVIRPSKALSVSRYTKDKETLMEAYNQGKSDAKNKKDLLIKYLMGGQ
ncbi:putative patatin/cPLA2 family phospholipase [Bacilli bacterium PM5-3]|nr:putative patatin/cPLA2 family phospholipase [Bacilli bacterium PM5-3]MDH6603540.1 putative patatin/cPLA2 family phospholipase [Bacilli bacterium PM5-9]